MIELSAPALNLTGILMLAYVTIESGGWYLTRVAAGHQQLTDFQRSFHRAGHGHAGMLVTVGILSAILTDATSLTGFWQWLARSGIAVSAILMPAGFFFSSLSPGATRPNRAVVLVWAGAMLLAAGAISLGVGLLQAAGA